MNILKNTNDGFQTKIWGPGAWLFLHTIAFNYKPEKRKEYFSFFNNLANILPCKACRLNYKKNISTGPLKLNRLIFKDRFTFSYWFYKLHNKISKDVYGNSFYKNNKKDFLKIVKLYNSFRATCKNGCNEPLLKTKKRKYSKVVIKPINSNKRRKDHIILLR